MSDSEIKAVKSQFGVVGNDVTITGGIHIHSPLPDSHSENQDRNRSSAKSCLIDAFMCNRKRENRYFKKSFSKLCKECPNHPQFYIIPGEEGECHVSLVEQLKMTRIRTYITKRLRQSISPNLVSVPWEIEGDMTTRQEILKEELLKSFDPDSDPDETISDLCRRLELNKYPIIIIIHDILASQWDKQYKNLIIWYIKEFWTSYECSEDMPQFLIFLNIRFPESDYMSMIYRLWNFFRKKRIINQLNQLKSVADMTHCIVFEELRSVTRDDVTQWFNRYAKDMSEKEKMEKISGLFKGKKQVSMAEAEHLLREITQKIGRETSGIHA